MSRPFVTQEELAAGLRRLGLAAGDTVLVHSSLSAFGHLIGGAQAALSALLDVLTPDGTLVVPTHTPENSDPDEFAHPPLPLRARPLWRAHFPPFDVARTPCGDYMGVIAELARTQPGARRSAHPCTSFSALGRHADVVSRDHARDDGMGERSPLARVYELDGKVLLLGVGHDANSSLHLAQARAGRSQPRPQLAAVQQDGARRWIEYAGFDWDDTQLLRMGADFERAHAVAATTVGAARLRLFSQRALVDFATGWILREAAAPLPSEPALPELLRTPALTLRKPRVEDAALLWPLMRDERFTRALALPPHASPEDTEDFVCRLRHRWARDEAYGWLALAEDDATPRALLCVERADPSLTLSLGLRDGADAAALAPALREAIAALFGAIPAAARVQLVCEPSDAAQLELAERCGFTREGCLRRARRLPDGGLADCVVLGLLRG